MSETMEAWLRHQVCNICWTASWAPCEEGTEHALADGQGKWMVCQMCSRDDHNRLLRARVDVLAAASLDAMQERVAAWHEHNFPDATEPERALIICEEVGELAHVVLKQSQGIRPESATDAMLEDAMGDIVIAILALAAHRGWSLNDIIAKTAETVLARDWTAARAALAPPREEQR